MKHLTGDFLDWMLLDEHTVWGRIKPVAVLTLVFGLVVFASTSIAGAGEIRPTIGNCLAAFAKSDEPRDVNNAIRMGMLGVMKYGSLPESERQAWQDQVKAERAETMKRDTSGILEPCRAQLELDRAPVLTPKPMLAPAPKPAPDYALAARAIAITQE